MGPTITRPVQDPLAVIRLENQLKMTSRKFGRFLTPLPLLCHTLMPLCHIMPNPLPPSWRDVIYHPRFTAFNKRLQMIIDKNNFLSVAAESLSATVVGVQN